MSFLNKKIINFSGSAFGLDLSDLSVKVIHLVEEGKRQRIKSCGAAGIPLGSVIDGEIINRENVVSSIRKAIENAGPKKIGTKKVICSLPEAKAFLRIINIPKMEEKEVREAIKWEMEANIPLSIEQVYYDWQVLDKSLSPEKGKISVLVVAVAQKVVDQFLEVLESAGLDTAVMEIESIAQARSLLKENDNRTTFIVDFGDRRTSFLISVGNIPCFTSSNPLSAQLLTGMISRAIGVPFEEAEKIKLAYGIGSSVKDDPIFHAVKPALENLVAEIGRSIDFYLTGLKYSPSVDRIIVCGGGANTKGLIPYISRRLGKEVELGDPWVNFGLGKDLPIIERQKSVQFSTAIGLALRALHYEDMS